MAAAGADVGNCEVASPEINTARVGIEYFADLAGGSISDGRQFAHQYR
jgi:hypothetical protein